MAAVMMVMGCRQQKPETTRLRSMYYWQTTLQLDSAERHFLRVNGVERLYVRYFDVVPDAHLHPVPNATLSFADSLPAGVEVVPVVYIVNQFGHGSIEELADKLLDRITQMNETHDISGVKEIQIDCDWTRSTEQRYFDMLARLRQLCHRRGLKLSATIRLHQLSMEAPPVDRGMLMMYNTGDVTRLDAPKPILDMRDVGPYLHSLASYDLPLATAYPLFAWRVLFRQGRFVGIMHADDDMPVLPGDTIVVRRPEFSDIMAARRAVDSMRSEANSEVVLYHLSTENIKRFSPIDYEKIYNPHR